MKNFQKGNRRKVLEEYHKYIGLYRSANMNEVCIAYNKFEDNGLVD